MESTISFLFLFQSLILLVNLAMAIPLDDIDIYRCRGFDNTTSPRYKNNIISTFASVTKNIGSHNGFYHSSAGTTDLQVNAIGLCPGYLHPYFCELCLNKAIPSLIANCRDHKEGVAWVSDCMVRYSGRKISGVLGDWVWVQISEPVTVLRPREMDKALYDLTTRLQSEAAGSGSLKKFASGNQTYAPDLVKTVYAVMQCTPDLSGEQCSKCLKSIILTVHSCCSGKVAARMMSPNCYLRYDHEKFDKS